MTPDNEVPMQYLTPEADRVQLPEPVRVVCPLTGRVHLVRQRVDESEWLFAARVDTVRFWLREAHDPSPNLCATPLDCLHYAARRAGNEGALW